MPEHANHEPSVPREAFDGLSFLLLMVHLIVPLIGGVWLEQSTDDVTPAWVLLLGVPWYGSLILLICGLVRPSRERYMQCSAAAALST